LNSSNEEEEDKGDANSCISELNFDGDPSNIPKQMLFGQE
jgi:hypothetical protein